MRQRTAFSRTPFLCRNNFQGILLLTTSNLFLWTEDLSVATQQVDEQHKGLLDLFNQLHASISEKRGNDTSREIFEALVESTRLHFLFEESMMRLTHYVGYPAHKTQHEFLMEQICAVQTKLDNETGEITIDFLNSHKIWWENHIRGSDRDFSVHYEQSELNKSADHENGIASEERATWWKFW